MNTISERKYCLKHPVTIIQLFGFGVFLGMLLNSRRGLLERALEFHDSHGIAMPGYVGRAYRLAALIEFRVAQLYARLAKRFEDQPEVAAFYRELEQEELEHGRLMLLCRYTVVMHPRLQFTPTLSDPAIKKILGQLKSLLQRVDSISLEEALESTVAVEKGEINTIFDRLLRQVDQDEIRLFEDRLRHAESHAEVVPERVAQLRRRLAQQKRVTHPRAG